ncbi:MAG: fatty acid oxidation complex subunit alpha FadJ [Gammaproteobacteria bacterium]|nr:fatty acid oxidation complex subunit alpha FadJ [Gammaproteobacteria bacterium]MDH3411200.1 fatty acid oxidation complex subunit alpha FadJ [Gammaproteobacteria bacterium]
MNEVTKFGNVLSLELRTDGVAIVVVDDPEASVNTLKAGLGEEFERLLGELERKQELKAVVLISGKADSFIVGADLEMLRDLRSSVDASALSRTLQQMQQRLTMLPVPTVVAIHGNCLGGGLELALTFDARVASDSDSTRFALPEVKLGLLPGGGGTQRLPRLIGVKSALDMMLSGRQLRAREAYDLGLVDRLTDKSGLRDAAVEFALALEKLSVNGAALQRPVDSIFTRSGFTNWLLAKTALGRHLLFSKAKKLTLARTRGNYPAPLRILEVVRTGLERGLQAGLSAETKAFGDLAVSPEARELINIFFATTSLKKDSGIKDASVKPREVKKIGVLGAGFMGAGIGFVSAYRAGVEVLLKDRDAESAERGLERVRHPLNNRVKQKRMDETTRERVMARITASADYAGFVGTDVVIEAVFEDLDLKHRMLRDIESLGNDRIIFATNTSSIPISDIAKSADRPGNVIGMHYFSPVEKMPLLEVIVTADTADEVTATCVALGKRQGKTVIVVNDGPGFYTSRVLAPYMNEAAWILSERVRIERIDSALKNFGFPVGPVALLDEVGIDVADKVGGIMHKAFGERMQPPPGLERLKKDDRLGRKNQRGFYWYGDGGRSRKGVDDSIYDVLGVKPDGSMEEREISERCVLQMLNEAARCRGEGILRSPRDGDIGAVFGLGFPPFHGGPFRFIDALGVGEVVDRLQHYTQIHGLRFEPAPLLLEMASEGRRFYS